MLIGQNVIIRKLEKSDLIYKTKWVNDPDVNGTLLFDFPLSLSETEEWYKKTHFDRTRWDFIIIEKSTEKIIGMTGLINLSYRHNKAQFFITIGEKSGRGKGYSKEVISLVLKFGFEELGLNKIFLLTLENNIKARQIYEAMGFKEEAYLIEEYKIHGKLNNIYRHAIFNNNNE